MGIRFRLLFALVLVPIAAMGGDYCNSFLNKQMLHVQYEEGWGHGISYEQSAELVSAIQSVNSQLHEHFLIPEKLNLFFKYNSDSAYYAPHTPLRCTDEAIHCYYARKGSELMARSILVHEYGHAVFDRMMREVSADWRYFSDFTPEQASALRNRMDRMPDPAYDEAQRIRGVAKPFDEFFADMVAVVESRSPRAVSDALNVGREIRDAKSMRSFEALPYSDWETFLEAIYSSDDLTHFRTTPYVIDSHVMLTPMRRYVGSRIMTMERYERDPEAVLREVYDVVQGELLFWFAESKKDGAHLRDNFENVNRHMKEALDRHFGL